MKYFAALPVAASVAAAQMQVMSLSPEQPAAGAMTHTVCAIASTLEVSS